MDHQLECKRCLLDKNVPGVKINDIGICSVCREFDRDWGDWDKIKINKKAELEKIVKKAKKKKRIYDCLIPISGGKDSVYVLYYAQKHLNLNCLAITFDNGLLSDGARRNISNACEKLDTDHIYYGFSRSLMLALYREFFLKSGFFCPVCMRGIQVAISRIQLAFNIPIAFRGTCHRTEEYIAQEYFIPGDLGFIESVLEGNPLYKKAESLLLPIGIFRGPYQIKLPDYIDWNYDEIFKTITEELNWTAPSVEAEHSDCLGSDVVHYIRWKKFPSLVPERLRYSKLVTAGIMTREEAQHKIEKNRFTGAEPLSMKWFLNTLDISRQEFDRVISNPLQHIKFFQKNRSRVKRRLKNIRNRIMPL